MSLFKRLLATLACTVFIGCGTKADPKIPTHDAPRVEVTSSDEQDEAPHMQFRISTVHDGQLPSAVFPFHVNGGEWTFFDCEATSDPNVHFIVGTTTAKADTGGVSAWGRAILVVKDQDAGGRFVELFAKCFSGAIPRTIGRQFLPQPLFVNTAELGGNLTRAPTGGFSVQKGDWTATKWFPEFDENSAEVYFNYNLQTRQGEFSEKDEDYRDDLSAIFA
jgi:hypothetical protein